MKTLIFTKIIITSSAFLITPNVKMLQTFIIKAVLNETYETINLEHKPSEVTDLINLHFGNLYEIKFDVDEDLEMVYNTDYKKIIVTALNTDYLSGRYH